MTSAAATLNEPTHRAIRAGVSCRAVAKSSTLAGLAIAILVQIVAVCPQTAAQVLQLSPLPKEQTSTGLPEVSSDERLSPTSMLRVRVLAPPNDQVQTAEQEGTTRSPARIEQLAPPPQLTELPTPPEDAESAGPTAVPFPEIHFGSLTPIPDTPLAFESPSTRNADLAAPRNEPTIAPGPNPTSPAAMQHGLEIVYGTTPLRSFRPTQLTATQTRGGAPSWVDLALPTDQILDGEVGKDTLLLDPSDNETSADELLSQDGQLPSPTAPSSASSASPELQTAEELIPTPPAENASANPTDVPGQPRSQANKVPGGEMDWIPDILPPGRGGSPAIPNATGIAPSGQAAPSRNRAEMEANNESLATQAGSQKKETDKKDPWLYDPKKGPQFYQAVSQPPPQHDMATRRGGYDPNAFLAPPQSTAPPDPLLESAVYRGKFPVPTQRPLVELWRPLYTGGIYDRGKEWFGRYNLVMPHFMVYGDMRTGVGINRNQAGDFNNLATRLNLDMDLEITATERLHAFMGPLDRGGEFTHFDFTNDFDYVSRSDLRFDTLFFEGDAGAILGGLQDTDAPFDLPFSFGFLPLFYQNGIWAADNVIGAAVALPSKHSRALKWSNFDATFFWASDQINSDAFAGDDNAAEFFGTAWFIEAYDGYIETNYAFVHDDVGLHRSYHNFSVAYTRRYFYRISNAVRFITNFGQALPSEERTADGHLLLIENSLITAAPNTFVPYFNFFYGQGRTQSLARAGVAGGILNNTGINFETDGLTGYPTLDATAVNTTGGAIGVNMLGANFSHQLILEFAALSANGDAAFRNANGDQYAFGVRYQKPLNNAWIFRTDHMYGWLDGEQDIRGSRMELRWKF